MVTTLVKKKTLTKSLAVRTYNGTREENNVSNLRVSEVLLIVF